jgi:alcohol dehydrogenase
MAVPDFAFAIPTRIQFGPDVVNRIGSIAESFGNRALLVTETALRDAGHIGRVREILRKRLVDSIIFDNISTRNTESTLERIVATARAGHVQLVVGLGGMRVLSAARFAAMIGRSSLEVPSVLDGRAVSEPPLPYIEIPSCYRNHFMFQDRCVVPTTEGVRVLDTQSGINEQVLVDPNLAGSLPEKYSVALMLDALLAAIEGYLSKRATFIAEALLIEAIALLGDALEGSAEAPGDMRHRYKASQAGVLASLGIAASSQGPGGAITYTVSSMFHVPKAWIASVLVPHVIDFNTAVRTEKLARIARALGEDTEGLDVTQSAYRASETVRRLIGRLGLPGRLREYNLHLDDMVEASEAASTMEMAATGAAPVTAQDIYDLIKQAF